MSSHEKKMHLVNMSSLSILFHAKSGYHKNKQIGVQESINNGKLNMTKKLVLNRFTVTNI